MINISFIQRRAEEIKEWMIEVRRDFHKYPELGMEEFRTRRKLEKYLAEMNIHYTTGFANTGVVGLIKGKKEGKTVALRADMDALPMEDKKSVVYVSKCKGKMHACGHDAHMTIVLGAAKILNEMKDTLKGNIKLLFQPAEETVGGAKAMIEAGVLNNPKVDAVLGLHVSSDFVTGEIGVRYGQMNASSDTIKIFVYGNSSHGAYPQLGIDSIVAAGQIITALQTVVSRNVDPRDSAVVTLGVIRGGKQSNIIADQVEIVGTVRTLRSDIRRSVLARIEKIVKEISSSMGARGEVVIEEGYVPVINHNHIVDIVRKNGIQILGKENINQIEKPSLGVEDFGYYLQKVPGAFFILGCKNEAKEIVHGIHTNYFDIDEECLPIGVTLQVVNSLSILGEE